MNQNNLSPLLDQYEFRSNISSTPKKQWPALFKQIIAKADAILRTRFERHENVRTLVYQRAQLIDQLLREAWYAFELKDRASLIAVGGYGRGELHPHSDIDLLILTKEHDDISSLISQFITFLWDTSLIIGHSVRDIPQCIEAAQTDVTVYTNLLENRFICGDSELYNKILDIIESDKIWPPKAYFEAKYQEQKERYARPNNSEYNLEPNVKNAPGGLRDIQMVIWITKRILGDGTLRTLHQNNFLTDSEYNSLRMGEEFLWRVRYGIHLLSKRPEERLLISLQRDLASLFGFQDNDRYMAVEQFMHAYYRWVLRLSQLNEVLIEYIREQIFSDDALQEVTPINRRFQINNGRLETTHSNVFARSPTALLELFAILGEQPSLLKLKASTIRQIRAHLHLIDDRYRKDIRNISLFMEIMRSKYNLVPILERMRRYGVLGAYLPEFDKITGIMQHDLFHRYTVDAHTLLLIKYLRIFYDGKEFDKFPLASRLARKIPKPELLFIAGLYHDIGKGRGGNHAVLGAVDARKFCERHALSEWDTELVVWLVEKHLLMSGVSQKQDLSDPEVIHRFAKRVEDPVYLDYLLCLTVADINATNPDLWNSWKAMLIRQLYHATSRIFAQGIGERPQKSIWIKATKKDALAILTSRGLNKSRVLPLWESFGDDYFLREQAGDIAWHTQTILTKTDSLPLVMLRDYSDSQAVSATQIFIRTRERDHVFVSIVTSISNLGLDIYDARIHSSQDGYTADSFVVLDSNGLPIGDDNDQVRKVINTIQSDLIKLDNNQRPVRIPRIMRYFNSPATAEIINIDERPYSRLEVIAPDRPGLLAHIGEVFVEFGVQLHFARIITMGHKVEDSFYITDSNNQKITRPEAIKALCEQICKILDNSSEKIS